MINKERTQDNVSIVLILTTPSHINKCRLSSPSLSRTSVRCSPTLTRAVTTSIGTPTSRWLWSHPRRLNSAHKCTWCQSWHLIRSMRAVTDSMLHQFAMKACLRLPPAFTWMTSPTFDRMHYRIGSY